MTLHCVSIDPGGDSSDLLEQSISSDDAVILLDRAADLASYRKAALSAWVARGVRVYILSNTVGIADSLEQTSVSTIDYAGWVKLSEQHASQRLWR